MIYVVGERPGGPRHSTTANLARLCGASEAELLRGVVWLNMFDVPGTDPRLLAEAVERAAGPRDAVLMLGRRVAAGWELPDLAPLDEVRRDGGLRLVAVPHPSGLNRWYNDPANRERARRVLGPVWRACGRS